MAFFLRKECFRSWIARSRDWREIEDSGRNHVKISSVKPCRELKNRILYRFFFYIGKRCKYHTVQLYEKFFLTIDISCASMKDALLSWIVP